MEKAMSYSKLFITGYDSTTKWMWPWFKENFKKHMPDANIHAYNFDEFKAPILGNKNWFKKPFAMQDAAKKASAVCWIDSDVEIKANVEDIFDHCEPNKLAMVEDSPWTARKQETWHNSGVVAFNSRPNILDEWAAAISSLPEVTNSMFGDQDVLHHLVKQDMRRRIHITDLPKAYNTLRLDLLDNTAPPELRIKMMHWTGNKGKDQIRSMMK